MTMVRLETLTEDLLFAGADDDSRELAQSYVRRVISPARRDQLLSAQVQGQYLYDVQVAFTDEGILNHCTCSWGGNCKHVYAVLLKWLQAPETFAVAADAAPQRPLAAQEVPPPPSTRPEHLPAWAATTFAGRQQALVGQLAEELHTLRLQDLRAIARRRGWRLKGTDKQGITLQIATAMVRAGDTLQTALSLGKEHRAMLAAMILMGPGARAEDYARLAAAWGAPDEVRQAHQCFADLQGLGLALPVSFGSQGLYGHACPDTIARTLLPLMHQALAQVGPGPGREAPATQEPGSEVRLADPFPFVRRASQLALLLERSPVPLRPPLPRPNAERQFPGLRGWDYDPAEVQLAQQEYRLRRHADLLLSVPPPRPSLPDEAVERLAPVAGGAAQLEFTYALLVAAGILQPGSPVTVWPEVKHQYLCRNELEQRAVLARSYFGMTHWSELWALCEAGNPSPLAIKRHAAYAYYTQDRLRIDLTVRRMLVLRALACLPDDHWIALADLFRLLRPAWPRFDELPQRQPGYYGPSTGWFLARAGSDARFVTESNRDWDLAQGRFVSQVLSGPLHWLGLADLRLQNGELTAFRLHGLAGLFWDLAEAPPAPAHTTGAAQAVTAGPPVTVEGLRITVCPSAISSQAHGLLERIARLSATAPGRFDYELDAQATYQAFEEGLALGEIADAWQRLLPIAMPATIQAQLADWWAAYGRVRIYRGLTVIEFADDYALSEMKAVTSLSQHIVAQISPRLVIVDERAADALVHELERAGYTPKRTEQA